MFTRRAVLIAGTVTVAGLLFTGSASASGADDLIEKTGNRAFTTLSGEMTDLERERRFRSILNDNFDLKTIGRFVLGRYWRRASKQQQREYISLFEDFIVLAYSHRFKNLSGKVFRVKKVVKLNARDELVMSEVVVTPGKPATRVNWRVRGPDSGYRIVDVMVEGVSMSITQRDEFAAVIRRSGGKVEGLLAALRKKTGRAR